MNTDVKITSYNEPFPYLLFEDIFSEEELKSVWLELEYYCKNYDHFFLDPSSTGSAMTIQDSTVLKKNKGFFMNQVYNNPSYSTISRVAQGFFRDDIVCSRDNKYFSDININSVSFLLSHYMNGDYYKPHKDTTIATACLWLYKEPQKFEGGIFKFTDYDLEIESKSNSMIVFPGNIKHEVSEVKLDSENYEDGRFTISLFMNWMRQ